VPRLLPLLRLLLLLLLSLLLLRLPVLVGDEVWAVSKVEVGQGRKQDKPRALVVAERRRMQATPWFDLVSNTYK
jgi:hypothetical protein